MLSRARPWQVIVLQLVEQEPLAVVGVGVGAFSRSRAALHQYSAVYHPMNQSTVTDLLHRRPHYFYKYESAAADTVGPESLLRLLLVRSPL